MPVECPPPAKKRCALFAHYQRFSETLPRAAAEGNSPRQQLTNYLEKINQEDFDTEELTLNKLCKMDQYASIMPLFQRLLCVPATSAPVERIFSQSGIIMRPHRAHMSDALLETLMFLKCNQKVI